MSAADKKKRCLGFPVPLLGMRSRRLPVLWDDGELLALDKPSGIQVWADNWYPRTPVLVEAIRHQAELGKPEFARAGIGPEGLWAVQDPDPEVSALTLWTRGKELAEKLRNELGSGRFEFRFRMLSKRDLGETEEWECDLPLARHREKERMVVSHKTGKQARTRFRRIGKPGGFTEWEAVTPFPRRHQIPVHAMESGVSVVGDFLYAGERPVFLSQLKRHYRSRRDREERPLMEGPAYFLESIRLPDGREIHGMEPPGWKALTRQLARLAGG